MTDRRLYSILTVTGAAPFVAAALLPLLGFETIGPLGPAKDLALSYGLAIVCFLAGVHWATWLYLRDAAPFNLFIASNVIVLACWFPYVLDHAAWTAAALIAAFLFLLFVDTRLEAVGAIDAHYLNIRRVATGLAVVSLAAVAVVA